MTKRNQNTLLASIASASVSIAAAMPFCMPPHRTAGAVQSGDESGLDIDARKIDRVWVREWERFAHHYLEFEGAYVCFPTYDPDRPSSQTMTLEMYLRDSAYEGRYLDSHNRERTHTVVKPIEEAQAALWLLYHPSPGDYGYIQSGFVYEILNERELVLRAVKLLNGRTLQERRNQDSMETRRALRQLLANQTTPGEYRKSMTTASRSNSMQEGDRQLPNVSEFINEVVDYHFADRNAVIPFQHEEGFARRSWRVVGYNTDRIEAKARWPQGEAEAAGLHLAIVAVDEDYITAVPAVWLERELTELQFLEVIDSRGLTKSEFVEMVNQNRREHRREYVEMTLREIEHLDRIPDEPSEGPDADRPVNDTVELAD